MLIHPRIFPNRYRAAMMTASTVATQFTDLNDDCLYDIFDHLPLKSLAAIALTNVRLYILAQRPFRQRYLDNHYALAHFPDKTLDAFGTSIESLRIQPKCGTNEIMHIAECCPNLRRLSLDRLRMEVFTKPLISDVFDQLTHLDIHPVRAMWHDRYANYVENAMEKCSNLRHLSIRGDYTRAFLRVKYPRLRTFAIHVESSATTPDLFRQFCANNAQIQCLRFHSSVGRFDASGILLLRQLRTLQLATFCVEDIAGDNVMNVIAQLGQLTALRYLSIAGFFSRMPPLLHLRRLRTLAVYMRTIESIEVDVYEEIMTMPYFAWRDHLEQKVPCYDADLNKIAMVRDFRLLHDGQTRLSLPALVEFVRQRPMMRQFRILGFLQTGFDLSQYYTPGNGYFGGDLYQRMADACTEMGLNATREININGEMWWDLGESTNVVHLIRTYLL